MAVRSARVADPRKTSLQSLRPGGGFNRSSKLKVRAARGCGASPDTDGLRIPSRVSSVRCGAASCSTPAVDNSTSLPAAPAPPPRPCPRRYGSRVGTAA